MASNVRISQTVAEIAAGASANARLSQIVAEVVADIPNVANVRVAQIVAEVVADYEAIPNQLVGTFRDIGGQPLANGYLDISLSASEAWVNGQIQLGRTTERIFLDGNGSIAGTVLLYPNDAISPPGSQYTLQVFTADGRRSWKQPHLFVMQGRPTPFDIGSGLTY